MIQESTISILIPTYNNGNTIKNALESVLKTDVLEIIISDDNSIDNTIDIIKQYNDSRIILFENKVRLGLWKNHQFLLKKAKGKWIKFLQADDYLANGSLKKFCNVNENNVSIISSPSLYINLENNLSFINVVINQPPKYFESKKYLKRIKIFGNELSTPSNTLYFMEHIPLDNKFWRNDLSCDFLINILLADKGKIVFIESGNIIRGIHAQQDTFKQGSLNFITRKAKTLLVLKENSSKLIKSTIHVYFFIEIIASVHEYIKKRKNFSKREKRYLKRRIWQHFININYVYITLNLVPIIMGIFRKHFCSKKYKI